MGNWQILAIICVIAVSVAIVRIYSVYKEHRSKVEIHDMLTEVIRLLKRKRF